jgi:hypothetical protein
MVLRKPPPPGISVPQRGTGPPPPRSSTSPPASNSSHSSPSRLTRQRPSPTGARSPAQVSVYSPDLHTSPAFDLMPLDEAQQKSPLTSSFNEPQNPWAEELVERPDLRNLPPGSQSRAVGQPQQDAKEESKSGISRIPPIVMAGTVRRQEAAELQRNRGSDESSTDAQWESGTQQLRSNNPFLRARNPSPNPWEDHNGSQPPQAPEQNSWSTSSPEDPFGERISQSECALCRWSELVLMFSLRFRFYPNDGALVFVGSNRRPLGPAQRSIR